VLSPFKLCRLIHGGILRASIKTARFRPVLSFKMHHFASECLFICCATSELLTEALAIRDGRTAVPQRQFCERNQSKTKAVCYIGCNGPFLYGFVTHYIVLPVQCVRLIFPRCPAHRFLHDVLRVRN
jgi:hypothetical protein